MRYRKRGRPKLERSEKDLGTQELQSKRTKHQTEELLDRYLRLEMINEQQHWCGNHFRWLYASRYGVPNLRAASAVLFEGSNYQPTEEHVQQRIEQEYKRATSALKEQQQLSLLLNSIIYSQCVDSADISVNSEMVTPALDILVQLWC